MTSMGFIFGATMGAGITYLLDPDKGTRRRALTRDKLFSAANRLRGFASEIKGTLEVEYVSDRVLEERVRSQMGRIVSHPGSIEVRAEGGRVILSGPILASEVEPLLEHVSAVRGVSGGVENRLEVYNQPGDVPGLQGESALRQTRQSTSRNWSPRTRLVVGLAGGALEYFGVRRRNAFGAGLGITGLALLARSLSNVRFKQLVGAGKRNGGVSRPIILSTPLESNKPSQDMPAETPPSV